VFEQKQDIPDLFRFAQFYQLPLQAQASGVVDGAELDDGDQILCHGFTQIRTD